MIPTPYRGIPKKPQLPSVFDFSNDFKKLAQLHQELDNLKKEHDTNIKTTLQKHTDTFQKTLDKKIEEIDQVLQRVLQIQKGDKGDKPVVGIDYQLPVDGKPGEPGLNAVVDENKIAHMASKLIKVPKLNHQEIVDKIFELLDNGKRKLSTKHIGDFNTGLEQTIAPIRHLAAGFRGGGDTVVAGNGVTITQNANGNKVITASGATSIYSESFAGIGTAFTLAHTPVVGSVRLYRGGSRISVSASDYTISGANITLSTSKSANETIEADYLY